MEATFLTNEDEKRIVDAACAGSVLHTEQELTEAQKAQARKNIGAVSAADAALKDEKVYEKIATVTVTADKNGSLPKYIMLLTDSEDQAFALTDFMIKANAGFVDGSKSTLYMTVNGSGVITNGAIGSVSSVCRGFSIFFRREEDGFVRVEYTTSMAGGNYYNAQAYIDYSRLIPPISNAVTLPVTSIVLYTELGDTKAWVEGSTFELWGIRA